MYINTFNVFRISLHTHTHTDKSVARELALCVACHFHVYAIYVVYHVRVSWDGVVRAKGARASIKHICNIQKVVRF